jgi:hypothetical protein
MCSPPLGELAIPGPLKRRPVSNTINEETSMTGQAIRWLKRLASRARVRWQAGFAVLAIAVVAPLAASAATPATPRVSGPIPYTQTNPIWMASQINLSRFGYIEEEYFVDGNANVYATPLQPTPRVVSTVPYRTRILVRRPAKPANYSGNVVLEPIHPSRSAPALGLDFRWVYTNGDVWVGVEPPGNIGVLQQFNPSRYSSLTALSNLTVHDLLAQVAVLLQSNRANPIPRLKVRDVFMQGNSATCSIVTEYINSFHRTTTLANGNPIVSGYLPSMCATLLPDINVPIIRVMSQWDFRVAARKPDSDDANGRYRLYEVAGAAHFTTSNPLFGENLNVIKALGITGSSGDLTGCKEFGPPLYAALNDFPTWAIMDGAMRNLQLWVQKGTPPPRAERFVTDASGAPILDQFGNFQGGLRTPAVDVPTANWHAIGTDCFLWGYKVPFTGDVLEQLYRNHNVYERQVTRETERLFREGWLTEFDAQQLIHDAQISPVPDPEDAALVPRQPFYPLLESGR